MKKKKELKSTDISQGLQQIQKDEQITDIQATTQTKSETRFGLLSAESGKIKVGMFYYNEDKTFSKRLVAGKQVSGVVVFVDESGQHGLIDLLRQKILPWSSDGLFVALPEGLSGKENTRLIIEAAQQKGKRAEAAEYCANYAYDGIKAGEAFLPSKEEQDKTKNNFELIKFSLHKIKAKKIKEEYYWSSSEYSRYFTWSLFFYNNRMYVNLKRTTQYVRPMMSF